MLEDDIPFEDDIRRVTYQQLKREHKRAWDSIWKISEVTIDGDDQAEQALNYSIYHLNCIAPRNLHGKSIPARGLSGQVYKGAIFWDTEMFMLDYYIYTAPDVARTLLQYRIDTLDGARKKAAEYGLNGAYYAWESQEGGYEACTDFNIVDVFTQRPVRTYFRDKQYHLILKDGALEVIVECARFYRSILIKQVDSDDYEIRDVVGPDEYHERVNNNAYTNRMAKFVFESAVQLLQYAKEKGICGQFDDNLQTVFADSAAKLRQQMPDERGVIEQFDGYFHLEDTDIETLRSRLRDTGAAHMVLPVTRKS